MFTFADSQSVSSEAIKQSKRANCVFIVNVLKLYSTSLFQPYFIQINFIKWYFWIIEHDFTVTGQSYIDPQVQLIFLSIQIIISFNRNRFTKLLNWHKAFAENSLFPPISSIYDGQVLRYPINLQHLAIASPLSHGITWNPSNRFVGGSSPIKSDLMLLEVPSRFHGSSVRQGLRLELKCGRTISGSVTRPGNLLKFE